MAIAESVNALNRVKQSKEEENNKQEQALHWILVMVRWFWHVHKYVVLKIVDVESSKDHTTKSLSGHLYCAVKNGILAYLISHLYCFV